MSYKIIAWNCQGLGNPDTKRALRSLVEKNQPDILFLSETRLRQNEFNKLRSSLKYSGCFVVDSSGRAGGLGLLWLKEVNISLRSYSQNHIDVEIEDEGVDPWRFTGIYGLPEKNRRKETWKLLKDLSRVSNLPWICAGNFNEILHQKEKIGGCPRDLWQMNNFANSLRDCNLHDLGFSGPAFTWSCHRPNLGVIRERLDRVVGSASWKMKFPDAFVEHIFSIGSDHDPIKIETSKNLFKGKAKKNFISKPCGSVTLILKV